MNFDELDFLSIPQHLQSGILKKFTYREHAIFNQCCKYADVLCALHRKLLYPFDIFQDAKFVERRMNFAFIGHPFQQIPPWGQNTRLRVVFHAVVSLGTLSNLGCDYIVQLALHNKICFNGGIKVLKTTYDAQHFNDLLKECNIHRLILPDGMDLRYEDVPQIQKVENLFIGLGPEVSDTDLVLFGAPHLRIINCLITAEGIVHLLKQWIGGTRDIASVNLIPANPIDKHEVFSALGITEGEIEDLILTRSYDRKPESIWVTIGERVVINSI